MNQPDEQQNAATQMMVTPPADTARRQRIERFMTVMACPACCGDLTSRINWIDCTCCGETYPVRAGRIYFCDPPPRSDYLDSAKVSLRHLLGSKYPFLVGLVGPTLLPNYRKVLRRFIDPSQHLVVDIGSGDRRVHADTLCVDWNDHHEVDVVCKLPMFPFKSDRLDGITAWNVLEQLEDSRGTAGEMTRSLRPGGYIMAEIPFMMPFHANPEDHQRFTHQGAARLFQPCTIVDQWNSAGPFSLFCFVMAEFLAAVVSFGLPRHRAWLFMILCAVLSPLKYLDVFCIRRPPLITIAPSILTVACKPQPQK